MRTRFGTFADLERAVERLASEDGRLFVPLVPDQISEGEALQVVFTTEDGAAAVNRVAVVASTAPELSASDGRPGVMVRLPAGKRPAPAPARQRPARPEELRNPLAGLDSSTMTLLVEGAFTESNPEVRDDVPCVDLRAADDDVDDEEPTRQVPGKGRLRLAIEWADGHRQVIDDRAVPVQPRPLPARWRPAAGHVLIGVGLGAAAALAMVLAPLWMPRLLRQPLPAVIRELSGSIAALDRPESLPRALLLATRAIPPLIPPAAAHELPSAPAEEPEAASCEVRLSSRPSSVEIWSSGRRLGRTPSRRLVVPCGAELVLKRPRYETAAVRAAAQPGGGPQALAVSLVRPPAHLEVTSAPAGAEVRIHGRTMATTPANLTIDRYESVSIEVRAPRFRTWKKRLYVRGAELAVQADLVARSGSSHRRGDR